MIIEICAIAATVAFIILVVFLIMTFITTRRTLKETTITLMHIQRQMQALSKESISLIQNTNDLTLDIKKKSESLNFIFHALASFNKNKFHVLEMEKQKNISEKISEILECVGSGIILFNKIKEGIGEYAKHR
ncbi:MAG: hypothetical protein Tsb0015_09580 [Simkaniaceae bacterium]